MDKGGAYTVEIPQRCNTITEELAFIRGRLELNQPDTRGQASDETQQEGYEKRLSR